MKYITFMLCFAVFSVIDCKSQTKSKPPQPMWNATFVDKLRSDLLLNYDKFARPTEHFNRTSVSFGMNIRHIDVDEAKSTLTVNCWLRMTWFDEKLKWNPDDYGGVGNLNLAEHEIWQPDIHLHNSAASTSINNYGGSHCIVYHNGEVLWVPPAVFTVLCPLNLKYWPFDTQDCYMRFSSWTYNGDQITLKNYGNSTVVETELVVNNTEWLIERSTQAVMNNVYPCCETFPDITVNLTISRISPSYKSIIMTPTFVIITTILMSFWLPPQAGEKILMNLSTSLMICLCMFYFVQKLPAMGNHTPLVVLFYSCCLYITTFSTISSVIVIMISRMTHKNPLPWAIKYPLTGTIGKIFLLGSYINQSSITHHVTAEEMLDHRVTDFDDDDDCSTDGHKVLKQTSSLPRISHQQDWILLAAAVDRVAFLLNGFIFCIIVIVYAI